MNNLSVLEKTEGKMVLSAVDIRAQVNLIQEVMKGSMKENVHFGKIPGCGDKPTLLKPGAEKILSTFRIAVDTQVEADLSTSDEIRYRIKAVATHAPTGMVLGSAMGECSTGEDKFKWRKAVCKKEFEETPENRRRSKWKTGSRGDYQIEQVRTEPSDLANTVLKMAAKRAEVAVTLRVTAASDIFTQDIEDLPEEIQSEVADQQGATTSGKPEVKMPQEKEAASPIDQTIPPSQTLSCSKCAAVITKKVNDYSIGKYKKALCYDCQKTA